MERTEASAMCDEKQNTEGISHVSMAIDYKKFTKNVLCMFAAILGIGILSVATAFMAVLGGIVCIVYMMKSFSECIVHDVIIILSHLFSSCILEENNPTDDSSITIVTPAEISNFSEYSNSVPYSGSVLRSDTLSSFSAPSHSLNAEHFIVEINVADIEKDKVNAHDKLPLAVAVNHQKIIPYTGV